MAHRLSILIGSLSIMVCTSAFAQQSVTDLGWMTGSWSGKLGPSTIEEIWTTPSANSIQASVRILADGATIVHEFIVITQTESGLVLSLQQWGPGYVPLGPATKMTLSELTENSVTFDAEESASIKRLTYRRRDEQTFEIAVTTQDSPEIVIVLTSTG